MTLISKIQKKLQCFKNGHEFIFPMSLQHKLTYNIIFWTRFLAHVGKIHNIFGMNQDIMMSTTIETEVIAKS